MGHKPHLVAKHKSFGVGLKYYQHHLHSSEVELCLRVWSLIEMCNRICFFFFFTSLKKSLKLQKKALLFV